MTSTRTMTNIAAISLIAMSITGCSRTTAPVSDLTWSVQTGDLISTGVDMEITTGVSMESDSTSGDEEALKILNQILEEVEALSGDIEASDKTNK